MVRTKQFKLTIVVAIYNIENELSDLLIQIKKLGNYSSLEILLINDGSSDNSEQLLIQFKQSNSNPNFRVIERLNGGLSVVRNQGLILSNADYVWFVDGDDIIDPLFVSELLRVIDDEHPDFIQFYYQRFKKLTDVKFIEKNEGVRKYDHLTTSQWFSKLTNPKEQQFENYAWSHVVKRSLYIDNHIFFPIGRSYEDVATTFKLASVAHDIFIIKEVGYFYRNRRGSITNNYSEKNCRDLLNAIIDFTEEKYLNFSKRDQHIFVHRYVIGAYYMANKIEAENNVGLKREIREQLLRNKFSELPLFCKIEYLLFYFGVYDYYRYFIDMMKYFRGKL